MSKEYVKYVHSEFVDYEGKIHQFVVAGVSVPEPMTKEGFLISLEADSDIYSDGGLFLKEYKPIKGLLIGVSVCSPKDEFNKELGEKIAYSKAVNIKDVSTHTALYTPVPGLINDSVVTATLTNYAEYIKRNPGVVVKGYNEAERKYKEKEAKNLAKKQFKESLPEEVKQVLENALSLDANNLSLLTKALENEG